MRPLPFLVLLSVALLLPSCKLLEEADTGRPDYTWTSGTPPSAPDGPPPTRARPDTLTRADTTPPDEPLPLRVPNAPEPPSTEPDTVRLTVVVDDSLKATPPPSVPDTTASSSATPPHPDTSAAVTQPMPKDRPPDSDAASAANRVLDDVSPPDTASAAIADAPPEAERPAAPEDLPEGPPEPPAPGPGTVRDTVSTTPSAPPPAAGTLDLVNRENRNDLSLPDFLTGRNKQGGSTALRFRRYVPPDTPSYVARSQDDVPLFLADETDEGWLGFYKGNCGGLGDVCDYRAVLYGSTGTPRWSLDLNSFLTQDRFVEIQDIRLHDGALYFNEACATYADETDGQCSSLVRIDPEFKDVLWRTPPLTSNNIFIFADPYVVAGYGFTAEPDALHLVEQRTGRIATQADLDSAHEYLEVQDGTLYVVTYRSVYAFDLYDTD